MHSCERDWGEVLGRLLEVVGTGGNKPRGRRQYGRDKVAEEVGSDPDPELEKCVGRGGGVEGQCMISRNGKSSILITLGTD